MVKAIDMVGQRFGRWTVLRRYGSKTYKYFENTCVIPLWLCRCDCGTEAVVNGKNLRAGRSKSCGCLRDEKRRKANG